MKKILIDTDITIDILKGLRKTVKKVEELFKQNELYISGITETEIFAGRDAEDNRKRKMMEELLSKFKKINPNNEICELTPYAGSFLIHREDFFIRNFLFQRFSTKRSRFCFKRRIES